jgi:hypothetical protein
LDYIDAEYHHATPLKPYQVYIMRSNVHRGVFDSLTQTNSCELVTDEKEVIGIFWTNP